MLRLLRRKHDKGIVIELAAFKGNQVEISIANPPDTKVWRGEVYDRIMEEKK